MSNRRPPSNSRPPERRPGNGRPNDSIPDSERHRPPRDDGRSARSTPPSRNPSYGRDPYDRSSYNRSSYGRAPNERPSSDRDPYERIFGGRSSQDRAAGFDAIDRASFERHFGPQTPPSGYRRSSSRDQTHRGEDSYHERREERRRNDEYRPAPSSSQRRRPPVKRRKQRMSPLIPMALIAVVVLAVIIALVVRACTSGNNDNTYTVKFSPDSQTLVVGQSATAKVAGLPDDFEGTINWSSSDTDAVSINNSTGVMQAKKVANEVSISARVNDKNVSATVKVIATAEGVKSLTLNTPTLSIVSGETYQLEFKAEYESTDAPVATPIWRSNSNTIATIANDGLVTARGVGNATITATLGTQSANCIITVLENPDSPPAGSDEGDPATDDPAATPPTGDTATPSTTKPSGDQTSGNNATTGTTGNDTPAGTGTSAGGATTGGTTPSGGETTSNTIKLLTLSQNMGYLAVGETLSLEIGVSPSTTPITCKSNNDAIATVSSSGVITATGVGSATITISAGTMTQTCTIEVSAADAPTEGSTSGEGGDPQPEA